MENLNTIPKTGNYGSGVDLHNDNYSKIGLKLETLENMSFNEKGYFESLSALQSKYPTPQSGWQAYVKDAGSSTGYYVANVNSSGNWVVTSAEAPAVAANLNDYTLNGGSSKTTQEIEDEIVQLAGELPDTFIKNLFDNSIYLTGTFVNSVDGALSKGSEWQCAVLKVSPNTTYTLSGNKYRKGLSIYDSSPLPSGILPTQYYDNEELPLTFTTGNNTEYVAFNLKSPSTPDWSNVQLEEGSEATHYSQGSIVRKTAVDGIIDLDEKTKSISQQLKIVEEASDNIKVFNFEKTVNINLLNPNNITPRSFIEAVKGGLIDSGPVALTYDTSDFIEVQESTRYTCINSEQNEVEMRTIAFYDMQMNFISAYQKVTTVETPINAFFLRFSISNLLPDYDAANIGMFEGGTPIWSPFGGYNVVKLPSTNNTESKTLEELATIHDVKNLLEDQNKKKGFYYEFSGEFLNIDYGNGDNLVLSVNRNRKFAGNDMFNFVSYNFRGTSGLNGDDSAPTHSQNTTIGANHGQPIRTFTSSGHGLTNQDIGTEWVTDNNRNLYILRIRNANSFDVLGENIGTNYSPSFLSIPSTGSITRGGRVLEYSSSTNQLYPSINNLSIRIVKDKETEIEDGEGFAYFIDIIESYDIMNISDILDSIKDRVGSNDDPIYIGSSTLKIENIYRILNNMTVLVLTNVKSNQPVAFNDIMSTQSALFGQNGISEYYVPNSLPISSELDFRKPLQLTFGSELPSIFFGTETWSDSNNPPNRVVTYYEDTAFTLGVLPTRGVGKNLKDFTNRTFEIRNNTGKIYPHVVEGSKVGNPIPVDHVFNMVMYRAFSDLTKTRTGNRMSFFNFDLDGAEYIFVDYSGSMLDKIDIGKSALNGRGVEVVESRNTILRSDTYNDGVYITAEYVEGETCYAILSVN